MTEETLYDKRKRYLPTNTWTLNIDEVKESVQKLRKRLLNPNTKSKNFIEIADMK